MRAAERGRGGFTLLEVLAAFALVAIAYTTLSGAGAQSLQKEGEAVRRLNASLIADRELHRLELLFDQGAAPPLGEEENVEGPYTVAVQVTPFDLAVPEPEKPRALEREEDRARRPGESLRDGAGAAVGPSLIAGERGQPGPLRRVDVVVRWDEGWSQAAVTRTTFGLDPQAASESLGALSAAAQPGGAEGAGGSDASGLGGRIQRDGAPPPPASEERLRRRR
jgi:prepilin-type N-terminal cleavage/methylation domain-containing protein